MENSFFDIMATVNRSQNHYSAALESAITYDEISEEFAVAEEGFFRDSKTPPKMIKKGDGDLVKYMTLQGRSNWYMSVPNEKWPKELLVRNDRCLSGFIKQGPDFIRKYTDYLKRGLEIWKKIKGDVKAASMDNNGEKWSESMKDLDKLLSDLSAVNRNFSGWQGDPTDITDQNRNKLVPLLSDYQKVVEDIVSEYYEAKGAYYQKSTLSRTFKYKETTRIGIMGGINALQNFAYDLWALISDALV